MSPLIKNLGYAVLVAMIGVYVFLEMTGERGVSALIEKRQQIKALQEETAALERSNALRRDRIDRLIESREEQELEIRRRYRLQKPDTVDFYIPPDEVKPSGENPPTSTP